MPLICPSEDNSRMKTVSPLAGVLKVPSERIAAPMSARMSITLSFIVRWPSGISHSVHR